MTMTGKEIRQKFLEYFERHGHIRVRSSPLLPANDPTLLFVNAGMNQFKDVFLGLEKRDYVRACSSQKCLRAGGKHNDLDEVGKTARHQTFFEMLGNFSFGDYFKEDAIKFAWDLLVNEFKLDPACMWFTVFGGDDEVSADEDGERLWEQVGAPRERILRFGRKDNFWQMGDTGPCGPCSEIHYYMGPDPGDADNCAANVNGPGDTITEIWNLVFMQFDRSEIEPGKYTLAPLPAPSVDTGMGLERLAVVLQGVTSNYETDLLKDIVEFTADLAGRKYKAETHEGFAMRVIADHARATAFSIADDIVPGNEGRNYVLRKIMRRAIYQGRHTLGFDSLFFNKVTNFVVDQMKEPYPELEASRGFIERMVKLEEERFKSTMTTGSMKFEVTITAKDREFFGWKLEDEGWDLKREVFVIGKANPNPARNEIGWIRSKETRKVTGADVIRPDGVASRWQRSEFPPLAERQARDLEMNLQFVDLDQGQLPSLDLNVLIRSLAPLYDTFGTPRDLIRVKLDELGVYIEEDVFNELFDAALQELQATGAEEGEGKTTTAAAFASEGIVRSQFRGYEATRVDDARVVALIKGDPVQSLSEGDEGEVILDQTPFYAESGGQVGDVGRLVSTACGSGRVTQADPPATAGGTDVVASVEDTYSPAQGLIVHKVKVEKGTLKVGDLVTAEVDIEKRDATRRNHTATHLMHAALREVLGTHVKQAGSVVAPTYLRFDFMHYQPLTNVEIEEIERLVNYHILRNEAVQTDEMAIEEAMRTGAIALFGEKYGEKVRVLSIKGAEGVFSKELCGGTHVRATGDIGLFKITSDESIASGTRRIRAVTGADAFKRFQETDAILDRVSSELRTSRMEIPATIERLQDELKKSRREADELRLKIATGAVGASSNGNEPRELPGGIKVLARETSGLDAAGMRQLSDTLLARIKSGVVVLGRSNDDKVSLIVRTSPDLIHKVPAGLVIKELAPIIGGKGGGKPDMAEGGGTRPEKLPEALEASYGIIEKMLG